MSEQNPTTPKRHDALADRNLFWIVYIYIFLYFQERFAFEQSHGNTQNIPQIVLDPKKPLAIADRFLDMHHTVQNIYTLRHYAGDYYKWKKNAYSKITVDEIKSSIMHFLEKSFIRKGGVTCTIDGHTFYRYEQFPVTPSVINAVEELLRNAKSPAKPLFFHQKQKRSLKRVENFGGTIIRLRTIMSMPAFMIFVNIFRDAMPMAE